jgi:hypothetical protein
LKNYFLADKKKIEPLIKFTWGKTIGTDKEMAATPKTGLNN